jgi:hypothetical protein
MRARLVSTWNVVLSGSSTVGHKAKSLCVSFEGDTTTPYGELKKEKNKLQQGCFLKKVSMYGSRTPELLQQLARLLYDRCLRVWL